MVTVLAPARLDSRLIMQRGNTLRLQERIQEIERSSGLIRAYQPSMILGPLQTVEYAHAVFTAPRPGRPSRRDSPHALVATRASRYEVMRTEARRRWVLLHAEGALNWNVGGSRTMVGQIERLVQASRLPNLRLGIIPARTPSRVLAPHGFHLYDSRGVLLGTKTATALSQNAHEIVEYEALFQELEAIAVFDDDARAILTTVSDAYRADLSTHSPHNTPG